MKRRLKFIIFMVFRRKMGNFTGFNSRRQFKIGVAYLERPQRSISTRLFFCLIASGDTWEREFYSRNRLVFPSLFGVAYRDVGKGREQERKLCANSYIDCHAPVARLGYCSCVVLPPA
jgi:hypothetical protein